MTCVVVIWRINCVVSFVSIYCDRVLITWGQCLSDIFVSYCWENFSELKNDRINFDIFSEIKVRVLMLSLIHI